MYIYKLYFFLIFLCATVKAQKTNLAISKPVTNEYFGTKIVDEYRNLENLNDLSTSKWMEDQTKYSLSVLRNIPNRQFYIDKRLEFDKKQSVSINQLNITDNDIYFYLKRLPQEKTAKLFYRKSFNGTETEIFNPENFKPENKKKYQINYIKPSYDGSKVVIALTESGKEISEMVIYDIPHGKLLPDLLTNCWPSDSGGIAWLSDNNSFIYRYYPVIDPKSPLFLKDTESVLYTIGQSPQAHTILLSRQNNPEVKINPEDFPRISLSSKNSKYIFGQISGATTFKDTYYMPIGEVFSQRKWKLLFRKEEKITDFIEKDDHLIYISEKNGTNAIYSTSLQNPDFQNAKILVSNIADEVITSLNNLKEGFVFSTSKNGVEAKVYLYKEKNKILQPLPFLAGNVSITSKGDISNDFWIVCSGWKNDSERFKYDSLQNKFVPENIAPIIEYPEFKNIIAEEITIKSHDGLDIPVSLMYNKNIKRNADNPVLIYAYGAYGTNISPNLSKTYLLWVQQGGIVAIAHVRGGGEKGEPWHEGGYKMTKSNSWKDLISCAEYMISEKYTSKNKIAIWGASAGGITIGRAITARPDLFKVAIIDAGVVNTTRMEFTPNGLNSAKEFGSLSNESEFKALLEMDAYQQIRKGEKYPATLITSGINDPRVSPWMPTKFAAKLLAADKSKNPIFLKIDYEGGHGGDIPVAQKYDNIADTFAFALWQLGHPDYKFKEIKK
ncbi:prolyl oligopeptidase family serine peptidase [Chryseobacterium sediminis]|uniref:prolyl oligopeptidase n=1 Tax=Chryseobacterium sediminis TaxID=1679494 RepID=A0A5B2UAX5_9FLAO|nr:prolyl oligopeptidase family serine peptidase [Chryseobacterium sediminis]KAA2223814.1 prolyl oligopeptidase family serine peptidase [Chryseobacterium sediminis]